MDHQFLYLVRKPFLKLDKSSVRSFPVEMMEFRHFYGFAIDHSEYLSYSPVVGVLQSDRNDLYVEREILCFFCLECNPADTFLELTKPSETCMIAFRKYYQPVLVLYDIDCFSEDLIIGFQIAVSVTDPVNRKHLDIIKQGGNRPLPENIGTRQKHRLPRMCKQNSQSIHQGILMIGSINKMIVRIYVFNPQGYYFSVIDIIVPEAQSFL